MIKDVIRKEELLERDCWLEDCLEDEGFRKAIELSGLKLEEIGMICTDTSEYGTIEELVNNSTLIETFGEFSVRELDGEKFLAGEHWGLTDIAFKL